MEYFLLTLVTGVSMGCTFGLVGLAFTAIFNASRVINFANGDLAVVGAFAASLFVFSGKAHPVIGFLAVLALPMVAGLLINWLVEPSVKRKAPIINSILITMGGGLIIVGLIGIYTNFSYFNTGYVFGTKPLLLGGIRISPQYAAILVATAALSLAYWLFLNKTALGLALRALGINADMASLVGINTTTYRMLTWASSSIISGIAGFLIAPLIVPTALMGLPVVVNGFIAAVIGGFGYPLAAVTGGIVLGLLIQFFSAYVHGGMAQLVVFPVLLVVLVFRPTGIWGLKLQ
jgi:branched-chain amino acid transport system permease protein